MGRAQRVVAVGVSSMVAAGLTIGWFYERSREPRPQLVTAGSANVHAWLMRYRPEAMSAVQELYLDIASSDALKTSFSVFDYGRSVDSKHRVGYAGLASAGPDSLMQQFTQEPDDNQKRNNYWLALLVAKRPLFISYRGLPPESLKLRVAQVYPPAGGVSTRPYRYIAFDDFKSMVEHRSPAFTRYLPEEGSGTRKTIANHSSSRIAWPSSEQVPSFIDQLFGASSFVSIQSDLQERIDRRRYEECSLLRDNNMHTAAVCAEGKVCTAVMESAYTVVVKIVHRSGSGSNQFEIANRAECALARRLAPSHVDGLCTVRGLPDANHVLMLEEENNASLSEALFCP